MKTIVNATRSLALTVMALAAVTFVTAPISSVAQEKGAERLLKLNRPAITSTAVKAQAPVMSCPKCIDTVVAVAQPTGKGGRVETANIVRHECPSCSTKIVTQGAGKNAENIVKHECKMDGGSCCALKKS
jgi:hypothetical protein